MVFKDKDGKKTTLRSRDILAWDSDGFTFLRKNENNKGYTELFIYYLVNARELAPLIAEVLAQAIAMSHGMKVEKIEEKEEPSFLFKENDNNKDKE